MSKKLLWGLLVFAFCFSTRAQALQVPEQGTFKMRPEILGKHPRHYFTAEDIPEIRRQALGPRKWFLDRAKEAFGSYKGKPPQLLRDWHDYLYGF